MDTKLTENNVHPVIINVASEKGSEEDLKNQKYETHPQMQTMEESGAKKKKKKKGKDDDEDDKDKPPPVPMLDLFRYSTTKERCIMAFGILAAMLSGVCLPAMFILFGDVTNSFVYNDMINSITNESLPAINASFPSLGIDENTTAETVKELLTELLDVGDFFEDVVTFGVGTFIVGGIQMLMGYIFVTTMNYAAEGQWCGCQANSCQPPILPPAR